MNKERQERIKHAYNVAAASYADVCFYELYDKPLDKKLYDLFFERVINNGTVIELGCGPGEVANYLKMRGLAIIGIDISENMIAVARQLNPHIDFRIGDAFELQFEDASVAGIVAPYLIVNFTIDSAVEAFREMHRVLLSGGQLLISFHSGNRELEVDDFFVKGNTIPYTYFDPDAVMDALIASGFTINEYINRMPYEKEVTVRTYIFAEKKLKL